VPYLSALGELLIIKRYTKRHFTSLAWWFALTLSGSCSRSWVKVHGRRRKTVAKVVGATSSEDILVPCSNDVFSQLTDVFDCAYVHLGELTVRGFSENWEIKRFAP